MAMLMQMLNEAMSGCQEDPPKRNQQYYQPGPGNSRPNNQNASRPGQRGGPAGNQGGPAGNQQQSRQQPQQGGNQQGGNRPQQGGNQQGGNRQGGNGSRNPAAQGNQAQSRSAGAPQSAQNVDPGEWSRQAPQSIYGTPARWQDEMNLRDVQQSARGQQQQQPNSQPSSQPSSQPNSQQAAGSRQAPAPKGPAATKAEQRQQQQRARQARADVERDTVIGIGFTAAMKRGVAQAKPTPTHEEMVPQKDGGFVATIQKGFEGLFGKPTSKEEVLRKRGAVLANEYEAVPGDEIDQRVQFFARRLPEDVAGCLKIFRKAKGEYQINDEIVSMEQRFRQSGQGQTDKEIFVFWTTEAGEQSDVEPLGLYLSHAANVAYEVKQGGNVITQVPEHVRMSFHEEKGTKLTDGSADARFTAMEVAARQAKMREAAAEEWRKKRENGEPEEKTEEKDTNILDDALTAIGFLQAPAAAPAPVPQVAMAVNPAMAGQPMPMGGLYAHNGYPMGPPGANAGTFYGAGQVGANAGTFYGAGQASRIPGPQQGSMYSAAPPGMMASAAAAYPGYAAPMQRQGTMYAYGSAYAVPVR